MCIYTYIYVCVYLFLLLYLFNNHSLDSKKKTPELTKAWHIALQSEEYVALRS